MPSDKCNLITAKATGLNFLAVKCHFGQRGIYLLAYHHTFNAVFKDIPVSPLFILFIFADSEKCQFNLRENCLYFS